MSAANMTAEAYSEDADEPIPIFRQSDDGFKKYVSSLDLCHVECTQAA
jgi:hypothetical protein